MQQKNCFNSRKQEFKTPFGAVTEKQTVKLNIKIQCEKAVLAIIKDGCSDVVEVSMNKTDNGFSVEHIFSEIGLYFYYFILDDNKFICKGNGGKGSVVSKLSNLFQQTVYSSEYKAPKGYIGTVMYQIFPDRFNIGKGGVLSTPFKDRIIHKDLKDIPNFRPNEQGDVLNNDYFGGNLEGVIEKLDYIKSLGVSVIYFNPLFEAHSNHRYNTANYMNIDPLLGTVGTFKKLCKKAAKQGIKVVIDGVFSHTGDDSIYFDKYGRYKTKGAFSHPNSRYRSWYKFGEDGGYHSWWGFKTLPEVNETDPSFIEFICGKKGVLAFWLKAGASGFRLDVADELPDEFIVKINDRIKTFGDDKLLIGEVWEDATTKQAYGVRRKYLLGNELDSVMNYPFKDAVLQFVKTKNAKKFFETVMPIVENYPKPMLDVMMNFISTHDTMRAISAIMLTEEGDKEWQSSQYLSRDEYLKGVELLKLAKVLQFTLPGIPSIYYGDEIGMQGCKDPFNRGFFRWDEIDENVLSFTKKLSQQRLKYKAFEQGEFVPVKADKNTVAFIRKSDSKDVGVAVNLGQSDVTIKFSDKKSIVCPPWRYILEEV